MLNELAKAIHENAIKHGWWQEERSFGEIIALCHSELSEALEEYRNGHNENHTYGKCTTPNFNCGENKSCHVGGCDRYKPEGIPIELADCIIRILDYFGKVKFTVYNACEYFSINESPRTFPEYITLFHAYLSIAAAYEERTGILYLNGLIKEIFKYCEKEGIDINEAIKIKIAYNRTRPYKHGGKKI